jgi:hypothetical protein
MKSSSDFMDLPEPEVLSAQTPESLVYANMDRLAGDILDHLIANSGSINLQDCRYLFEWLQKIAHYTDRAKLIDVHYVNGLKRFLEYEDKRGAYQSFRAFVERFGSEDAKQEFGSNAPEPSVNPARRSTDNQEESVDIFAQLKDRLTPFLAWLKSLT